MSKELTPHQKSALNYNKHISLVANAGSGKTFVLSKRFVEIFKKECIDLNSIVAITFTDKAAGELNRKIADEIDEQIRKEVDYKVKNRLEKLRRELVHANISTIHSFCINILKEFAPEAGLDASFFPIDKITSDELIELSVEETLQYAIRDTELSKSLMHLVRVLGSKTFLKSAITDAIHQRRNVELLANSLYNKSIDEIAQEFDKQFAASFDKAFSELIKIGLKAIKRINDYVLMHEKSDKFAQPIADLLADIEKVSLIKKISLLFQIKKELITSTENSVRKVSYLSKNRAEFSSEIETIEKMYDEIAAFAEIDVSGKSEHELAEFGKLFLQIYSKALENYSQKKKLRSYLDFEDILLFTHKVIGLKSAEDYLHEKFKFIMIDEYQDTNELQYEIFMPILDHLKSGNLFVVGDEKQSIYMFRNAELEIFNRTKNDIELTEENGANLSLPHSFRMYPQLVLFTNKIFKRLFLNPQLEFNEVPHSDLICTKDDNEKGNVQILLSNSSQEVSESELVASEIIKLMKNDSSVKYEDVAILCRKRKSFSELEIALVKYGIPYVIMGGKGFYQRQSVYDIYNYISFLLNTKDDQALIGTLRSPFFNLSDASLFTISKESGDSFYQKLSAYSKKNENISSIAQSIEKNKKYILSLEPYSLIRKILVESGYWALLAAKKNSNQEIANVEKLLALSREYANKGFKNLYDFTLALKESIVGYEDEGQAQISVGQNAVKLMTIHQSKGLEFKAVFVYGTNTKGQDDNVKSRTLSIDKEYGLLTKVPLEKKYFSKYALPPIAAYYNYRTKRKNHAELKRLFYVAVTRAVKYLYISAIHKEFKPVSGSFYDLLTKGLINDFREKSIYLADEVEFMIPENDSFRNEKKRIELNILVSDGIEEIPNEHVIDEKVVVDKVLRNIKIGDIPKHEIISATKISMYTQCPVKYELTYDIGYLPIVNLVKRIENEFEFHPIEDEEANKQFAQLRGRIIHKCLSDNVSEEKLDDFILSSLLAEKNTDSSRLTTQIKNDILKFYKSDAYNKLMKYTAFENEYEVYCEENDFYLYGIIDKLIVEDGKLIVVDYKTDYAEKEKLMGRADNYFPQLKFYAYILSKLYKEVAEFELRLIFIKHPDELIQMKLGKSDLTEFGHIINRAIQNMNLFKFAPNYNHCPQCQYAMEGNICVKSIY